MNDKNKIKCEELIKKIFGSNFYFVHETSRHSVESILKSGYINISNEIDKKYWRWYTTDDNDNPLEGTDYVFCWMKHDDVKVKLYNGYGDSSFLIDPRILLHEDVIFNTDWSGTPIEYNESHPNAIIKYKDKQTGNVWTQYNFSIYLNKSDSDKERLIKLKKIKKYIKLIYKSNTILMGKKTSYWNQHEFLFPKKINLKKYLIGITFYRKLNDNDNKILNLLNNKYKGVKLFENIDDNQYYPKLMDVLW